MASSDIYLVTVAGCLTPPQREIGGDLPFIRIAMAAGVFLDGGNLEDHFHDDSIGGVMGEVIQRISEMAGCQEGRHAGS